MGFDERKTEEESIFDAFSDMSPSENGNTKSDETGEYDAAVIEDLVEDTEDTESPEEDTPVQKDDERSFETSGEVAEQKPFSPSKTPVSAVLTQGPRKLNKQRILYMLVGLFAVFIILTTFVSPLLAKKKQSKVKKPDAASSTLPFDYSTLVQKRAADQFIRPEEFENDDEVFDTLPPVHPEFQYKEPKEETPVPVVAGNGGTSARPDTKGDSLQGKRIAGIKGITPTQNRYLGGTESAWQGITPEEGNNKYARYNMPSKDEYTAQMLSQYSPDTRSGDGYTNQNDQSGKMSFFEAGRENAGNGVWLSPVTLWQGTIIEATLTSTINTDLPGEVTALVAKNIYSSLDGRYMLIPQNSRLFGSYNSSISYSQSRVQVGWHTLIRPDGYAVNLGNMAGTDARGAAGLKGIINDHPFQYLKAFALMSAFNIINAEFESTAAAVNNQYVQNVMADGKNITATLGSKLIDRALNVQPAITIKAGLPVNIVVNTNLTLPPLPPYGVFSPYHR
jgi:type IV secretion system protein VirB10